MALNRPVALSLYLNSQAIANLFWLITGQGQD